MPNKNLYKIHKQFSKLLSPKENMSLEILFKIENAGDGDSPSEMSESSLILFKDFILEYKKFPKGACMYLNQNGDVMVENDDIWLTFQPDKITVIHASLPEGCENFDSLYSEIFKNIINSIS